MVLFGEATHSIPLREVFCVTHWPPEWWLETFESLVQLWSPTDEDRTEFSSSVTILTHYKGSYELMSLTRNG
eukprot:gene18246-818_t